MKTDTRHRSTPGSWLRFAARLFGLVGVATAAAGGVVAAVESAPPASNAAAVGYILLASGGAMVAVWLAAEVVGGLILAAGRKTAEGTFTFLLGGLAVAAVVVVNVVSVRFYARADCTRDARFTLDRPLVDELKKLDPGTRTTVLVLQSDRVSALDPDQPDAITAAAQGKITEKVLDLIDELRQHPELSARLDVSVLSRKDERFEADLDRVTQGQPGLKAAVLAAGESSVFFASNDRVRRMPFSQFYLLDKTASRGKKEVGAEANDATANLVLAPQGKERFVQALIGLEERKKRVGVLTIHPVLTSTPLEEEDEGQGVYTAAGLRAALERDGCEVVDVVLKKGWDGGNGLSPSAGTVAESRLEEVEAEYLAASESAKEAEDELRNFELVRERVKSAPLGEVERIFRSTAPRGGMSEGEYREKLQSRLIDPSVKQLRSDADEAKQRAAAVEPEYRRLLGDDLVQAGRRSADVKARLSVTTADCDLLIVPRLTTINLVTGRLVPPDLYPLARPQTDVVKEFLAAGKPVLFAFGPTPGARGAVSDDHEQLLGRLGIELGTQTVITTAEAEAMKQPAKFGQKTAKLPPLEVVPSDNPVAAAFDRANRTVDGTLRVKRSGYRPIYLVPRDKPFPFAAALLRTTADAWNEDRPTAAESTRPGVRPYFPKFDTTKPDDPKKGTREEEKKQRFVVGAAVEVPVPAEWTDTNAAAVQAAASVAGVADIGFGPGVASAVMSPDRFQPAPPKEAKTVRVAVFGHGGLFVGKELDPGQEALLTSTVNWQLRRDDHLPKDVADADKWRYPRVPLSSKAAAYWQWGMAGGLPLAAALLGLVAWMVRRLR